MNKDVTIEKTIEDVCNELSQIINSTHRLNLITEKTMYHYYRDISSAIDNSYSDIEKIRNLEDIYKRIKPYENMLK